MGMEQIRKFHDFTVELSQAELSKIIRMTNCKIPCNYNQYKLANNPPRPFTDSFGNETVFGLLAVSENTEYQEEVLLYPLTSLIAEFGGSLGLFLGSSFMSIWDLGVVGQARWI